MTIAIKLEYTTEDQLVRWTWRLWTNMYAFSRSLRVAVRAPVLGDAHHGFQKPSRYLSLTPAPVAQRLDLGQLYRCVPTDPGMAIPGEHAIYLDRDGHRHGAHLPTRGIFALQTTVAGRSALLAIVLSTMMLPAQVTMIPIYLLWNALRAYNTYRPLITPAFFGTPFLIFMIRQFLINVPDELIQAARMDGASELRVYWSIVLPLARPALVTAAVFQFVWTWTDFLNPLIYLNDSSKYTLSIGLYAFFGQHDVAWGP